MTMKTIACGFYILVLVAFVVPKEVKTPIVDTGQTATYDTSMEIPFPAEGEPFFGQDAQYEGNRPLYRDNFDGTVTDLVTGLMWSKEVESDKLTPDEAHARADELVLGGYDDWRIPNIKELYSLIDFRGNTGFAGGQQSYTAVPANAVPYINTDYFDFMYGYTEGGERYIDAQWLSDTKYVGTTMGNMETVFGVNFADGRIKGYGYRMAGTDRDVKAFYVRYVRGEAYGGNDFADNGNGTITDKNTGLMWARDDSGRGMTWEEALAYAESSTYAGYDDWRLPNAKELQYLVDYDRAPDTTASPAIDPIFRTTSITNEMGQVDFPFFWTSTTHLDGATPAAGAVYISFGRGIGQMNGIIMDVHGAGAQRSDPKTGDARIGHGPQGDAQRIRNYVRLVRGGATRIADASDFSGNGYPGSIRVLKPEPTKPVLLGPMGGSGEPASGGQSKPAAGIDAPGGFVRRLDADHDGKVSRTEFDGPPHLFGSLDKNGDGFLSEEEAPREPPGGAGVESPRLRE